MFDGHGVDDAATRRRAPLERVTQAVRTDGSREMDGEFAVRAPLQEVLAHSGRVPEWLRRVRLGRFRAGPDRFVHSVASVPRTIVDMQDKTMPEPWATATWAEGT